MTYCPRCGVRLSPLEAVAGLARELVFRGVAARDALASMKLAVPAVVPAALADLATRGPTLIHALDCHAGTCIPPPAEDLVAPIQRSAATPSEGNLP